VRELDDAGDRESALETLRERDRNWDARLAEYLQARKGGDSVEHPPHYNEHPSGVECIAIIEYFTLNLGNAMKYIWRNGLKPGETAEKDLKKAIWYIQREIERLDRESNKSSSRGG
jgi:Protein of unknwon function (DUF3310)